MPLHWRIGVLLVLLLGGCESSSVPLALAEHSDPKDRHEFIDNAHVGKLVSDHGNVAFVLGASSLDPSQVSGINRIVPDYRAIVESSYFRSKATRVRVVIVDEVKNTLQFWLKNCESVTVRYPAVVSIPPTNERFIETTAGAFEIQETGIVAPCYR